MQGSSTATIVTSSDWASVISALTEQLNVQTVVGVMAVIVASTVGFAFLYWGVRKAVAALMGAFKKGRVSAP